MLSILIPVYNYQITDLVHNLYTQIEENSIKAEIIIVDDASREYESENSKLVNLGHVSFEKLSKNIGRSAIRNYLALKAKYNYLLFIDCDAKIQNIDFLNNYLSCIADNKEVVCGGLEYEKEAPENRNLYFRWYYGINREYRAVEERVKYSQKSFSSFNFLIKKKVFQSISFHEKLTNYGHEDTLFGIELKKHNKEINHINNPLLHYGLEGADEFISKTKQSVKNLRYLFNNYSDIVSLQDSIKLLKYVRIVHKLRLVWLFKYCSKLFNRIILKNLKSQHPSLLLFDFYKICYYFSL
ncbi:glycosyltransferase family 2 protein [Bacteroidota bacterium]